MWRSGREKLCFSPGVAERLPASLTEVLLARLDGLESQAKGVAQVGSVIGRSFSVRLLAQVMGQEKEVLAAPLRTLQQAEIAFPHGGGDPEYVFKHATVRDVAYRMLVQGRRRQLHLAVGRAIAQLYPADEYVEMIAYHFGRTEEDVEAAGWLERAGDRAAAIYANERAAANYEEARKRCERAGMGKDILARLDEKLGRVLAVAGRYEEALGVLTGAAETYRAVQDLDGMGRVTAQVGWTHTWHGTPHEGIEAIRPVLRLLTGTGPTQTLASLYLALAYLYFGSGQYRENLEAAERAGEIARAVGDERVLAGAEMRRGTALTMVGRPEEARRVLEGAIPLAEKTGDLEVLGIALNNAAHIYLEEGEPARAREHMERGLEVRRRMGNAASIGWQMLGLVEVLIYLGAWQEAEEWCERGREMVELVGSSWFTPYVPLHRGYLRLRKGRWEDAARNLEDAIALAAPIGDTQLLEQAHRLLGELEVQQGRADAARDRLQPLVAEDGPYVVPVMMTLARAYLALELLDQAQEAIGRGLAMARMRRQRLYLPELEWVQGMIRARQERWEEAEDALDTAMSLARDMPYPYAEGRALYEYGVVHLRRGDPDRGRAALEEAEVIFRRLGAEKDLERAENVMRALAGG